MTEQSPLYVIDPETLREVATDSARIQSLLNQPSQDLDAAQRVALLRIGGRLEEAELLALTQLDGPSGVEKLVRQPREASSSQARWLLRLATVWQWQGAYSRADECYGAALECFTATTEPADPRTYAMDVAFAYQHYGKSLFKQGHYREAESCFAQAESLRREHRAGQEMIDSSVLALRATRRRRANL
ncbi:tetratricopeptide repeat protein [Glutamicibacter endophyticus]|uniref:tetratricopeptide repeat protein n=1 Tax=Glutamicibacter endophyticus TaxID=1522174 RepID=UPI003AF0160D